MRQFHHFCESFKSGLKFYRGVGPETVLRYHLDNSEAQAFWKYEKNPPISQPIMHLMIYSIYKNYHIDL